VESRVESCLLRSGCPEFRVLSRASRSTCSRFQLLAVASPSPLQLIPAPSDRFFLPYTASARLSALHARLEANRLKREPDRCTYHSSFLR
jgi:hypothetical protein